MTAYAVPIGLWAPRVAPLRPTDRTRNFEPAPPSRARCRSSPPSLAVRATARYQVAPKRGARRRKETRERMTSTRHRRWTELRRAAPVGVALAFAGLGLAACSQAESAANYPTKPVRIFVPYGPGGVGDLTMRVLAA